MSKPHCNYHKFFTETCGDCVYLLEKKHDALTGQVKQLTAERDELRKAFLAEHEAAVIMFSKADVLSDRMDNLKKKIFKAIDTTSPCTDRNRIKAILSADDNLAEKAEKEERLHGTGF